MVKNFFKEVSIPTAPGNGQIKTIDFLRGIASLVILVVHYKHFYMGPDLIKPESGIEGFYFYNLLSPVMAYGANAVQLFWVISGYVFLHVYGGSLRVSGGKFLWHRFSRLYPLHFLTLIVIASSQYATYETYGAYSIYHNNDIQDFILHLAFASEWVGGTGGLSFNGPIWSVSVEIFSYLLFLFFISRSLLSIINITVLVIFFGLAHMFFDSMITLCLFYFFIGCLANAVFQSIRKVINEQLIAVLSLLGLSLSILLLFSSIGIPTMIKCALGYSALITLLVSIEYLGKMNYLSKLKWVGDTSYGNYLWHSPLQVIFIYLSGLGVMDINTVNTGLFFILYIPFMFGFSYLSFKFFERSTQKYLNFIYENNAIRLQSNR